MFFLKMKTMGAKLHHPHHPLHPLPRQTRIVNTVQTQKALLYSTKKLLRLALRVVLSFMCKYYLMMLSSGLHIYSEWLDHFCDAADFLRNAQASGGL